MSFWASSKKITANGKHDVREYIVTEVDVPNPSTGKLTITSTAEVDCSEYATAQVSDEHLVAENIKAGVTILGITGNYEGTTPK